MPRRVPPAASTARTHAPKEREAAPNAAAARGLRAPSLSTRVVENGILAAAMRVFARRGFAATRVEDVLEEAGVARRTFYRYFTGKEGVLAAVYELATTELVGALDESFEAAPEPLAALRRCVDLYLDFYVENAPLLRVVAVEALRADSPLAGHRKRARAHLVKVLVRAAERLGVAPLDGFTYVALVSSLEGVALELLDAPASMEEVNQAKKAIHALVGASLARR
jgi:AcrR family transcriptional regulator